MIYARLKLIDGDIIKGQFRLEQRMGVALFVCLDTRSVFPTTSVLKALDPIEPGIS